MKLIVVVAICAAGILTSVGPTAAESLEDGYAAYKRGDYAAAVENWRPLAQRGHPWSQVLLGLMYDWGKGVPASQEQARQWYARAIGATQSSGLSDEEIRKGMRGKLDLDPYELRDRPSEPYNPLKKENEREGFVDELMKRYQDLPIKPDIDRDKKGFKIEIPFGR